jgi:hypothetical protein
MIKGILGTLFLFVATRRLAGLILRDKPGCECQAAVRHQGPTRGNILPISQRHQCALVPNGALRALAFSGSMSTVLLSDRERDV